ncbi:MAG: NCS2 family permease [Verrucomicrobiae bacterium]|nr:NCS2 family permease [Verrucomicrobiae bacterium]
MHSPRWFVRGDIDGFFGLFIDNILQLMLIPVLCKDMCGFDDAFITGCILPGAALSILGGNLFYAWQAHRLAKRTGRNDVTALPYGINTVSLLAFIFLIMAPIYHQTKDPILAWRAGLFACFWNGVIEIIGAFVGDFARRHTPRAALLSALAGIALTFITMGFVFQIFASPAIALIPMFLIVFQYASGKRLPLGIPAGLLAIALGAGLAWLVRLHGAPATATVSTPWQFAWHWPAAHVGDLLGFLTQSHGWTFFSVIFPMGLFNLIGALQNLESAEAAGDRFETKPSLLANGIGSILASCLGSPFSTCIYIGHPGWKALGARTGYSTLNGMAITLICLTGGVTLILNWLPVEAILGILLWVGLVITAQSFQEVPKKHAPAVVLGLVPAMASWALVLIDTALRKAGASLSETASRFAPDLYLGGIIALSQGFLLTSMIFSAMMVHVVERRFNQAAVWAFIASALSMTGVIHAYELGASGVMNKFSLCAAPAFATGYSATGVMLLLLARLRPADS